MLTGILLAAGRGRRFQAASGASAVSKCLTPLADATPMVVRAALNLLPVVDRLVCVIRADDQELAALLATYSADCLHAQSAEWARKLVIVPCAQADLGMAESIKAGINASADSSGWLLAFADMPFIKAETYQQVAAQLQQPINKLTQKATQKPTQNAIQKPTQKPIPEPTKTPATICVPVYKNEQGAIRQGHPVAFTAHWRTALLELQGDRGAKTILQRNPDQVIWLTVTDPAIAWDVDEPADLLRYQKVSS